MDAVLSTAKGERPNVIAVAIAIVGRMESLKRPFRDAW